MSSESDDESKKSQDDKERKKETIRILQAMDIPDIKCGVASCTPKWLQVFALKQVYLIVYCIVGLVLGSYFTYTVSTISTLEKRFRLTSKQTGIVLAGNDISQILLSILIAYFGNYGNRPKWLGVGVLSASLSCFLSAVPHFVYGPGQDAIDIARLSYMETNSSELGGSSRLQFSKNKNDLCHSPYISDCGEGGSEVGDSILGPVILLFLSQLFVGVSVSIYYSLGLVYLDDNVNKKDSPLYYAVSMIIRVIGPVVGFFLGSKCLSYYIDPRYKPNISQRDPRWLGAWWLGFLILAVLQLVCGLAILFFPRTLPSTLYKQIRRIMRQEASSTKLLNVKEMDLDHYLKLAKVKQRFAKPSLAKLPTALKRLFTNKIWVGNNFNSVMALLALMGYWSFKPKYLEFQFRKSASVATFYTGIAGLVATVVGLGISGIIIRVFRPGPRFITGYSCFLTLFSALTMGSLMFVGCPKIDIVGPSTNMSALGYCNEDCGCTDKYSPVCSEDGMTTFHSPCYAGCTGVNTSAVPVEYLDCKCSSALTHSTPSPMSYELSPNMSQLLGPKTIQGYCPETCDTFMYYIILTIVTKIIDSTGRIGSTLVYLRSVEEQDKGLALGVSTVLISLFAFIPAPIIMGAVVDSACIIWDNTCGQRGNCWLYDSDKFRILIHAVPACIILVSLIGDIFVYVNSKDLILYGEDEEEELKREENGATTKHNNNMDVLGSEMKPLKTEPI